MLVIIKSERQCWNNWEGVELQGQGTEGVAKLILNSEPTFLSMQVREDVAMNTNLIKEKSTW